MVSERSTNAARPFRCARSFGKLPRISECHPERASAKPKDPAYERRSYAFLRLRSEAMRNSTSPASLRSLPSEELFSQEEVGFGETWRKIVFLSENSLPNEP